MQPSAASVAICPSHALAPLVHLVDVEVFIISTDVEYVYLNYGRPDQRALKWLSASEAQAYYDAGHFPPGNMGPKITAALQFLRAGGQEVIITAQRRSSCVP